MAKLPLDQEQHVSVAPLQGQQGRRPGPAVDPGKAALADNTLHQGMVLSSPPGTKKLVAAALPASGYELDGLRTGALTIPAITGYNYATEDWSIEFNVKLLDAGAFLEEDTDHNQVIVWSGINTEAQVGNEGTCLYVKLITVQEAVAPYADQLFLRPFWGNVGITNNIPFVINSTDMDIEDWFKLKIHWDPGTERVHFTMMQPQVTGNFTVTDYVERLGEVPQVEFWQLGSRQANVEPWFALRSKCHMVVSEFRFYDNKTAGLENAYSRRVPGDLVETDLTHVWPLNDSKTIGIASNPVGFEASLNGVRVQRDVLSSPIGSGEGHALRFDGSGMLSIPEAHRYRQPPGDDVPGYYLERDELTVGFFFRADENPFLRNRGYKAVAASEDRATLFDWASPTARKFGRPDTSAGTGYGTYHAARDAAANNTERPCTHLRVELVRVADTGFWQLHAYWGELDRESLEHPAGTIGGDFSQTWPPGLASDGHAPTTWNTPARANGAGGNTYGPAAAAAQNAQVIVLGHETASATIGLDDPMQYDWLVTVSRKFVDQGSAQNRARILAFPFNRSTGVWGEALVFKIPGVTDPVGYAVDANVADDLKNYPLDQSCFTSDYQGVIGVNYRPSVYAMSLGATLATQYGDEFINTVGTYSGTHNSSLLIPAGGDGPGFVYDKQGRNYGFRGWMKDFFILDKYISVSDGKRIAAAGGFAESMRVQFSRSILGSWTFAEGSGNTLRDMKGNNISYDDKIPTTDVIKDDAVNEKAPPTVGYFPRPPPPRHDEVEIFTAESSPVTGIVQRLDFEGNEEIYVTGLPGLYKYTRSTVTTPTPVLTRLLSLYGQGGPNRMSIVIDDADVIHIAGGPGRPVIITRDKTVALSGIFPPVYHAPDSLIVTPFGLSGGIGINPQFKSDVDQDKLVGWEIPDAQQVGIAVGYWSDILKTRSAPGPVFICRYTDPSVPQLNTQPFKQHRIYLTGLPVPDTENAELITHWDIYRTAVNGKRLFLETRVPIYDKPGTSLVGYKLDPSLVEQADWIRSPPPEGIKYLGILGERLFGIGLPERPRSLIWSRLRDTTTFPAVYGYTLTQTSAPAVGVRARRDRAFAVSRDYLYQIFDKLGDIDPDGRVSDSVVITPITEGAGALNQDAIADDEENGLYLFGNKSVFLTEGGIFRSVSKDNDSDGSVGSSWSWPDSWDLSDPDAFVSFHDEKRRMIGICGPSADDATRRDVMLICYEGIVVGSDGTTHINVEMSRYKDLNATCFASVFDPATGTKEVWFGAANGYIYKFGTGNSLAVDYDWLAVASPKVGLILSKSANTVRVETTWTGMPSDFLVGARFRTYRAGTLISEVVVDSVTTNGDSWTDILMESDPLSNPGDTFTIGAMPLEWRSGEMDMGSAMQDMRVMNFDIRLKRD